MLLLILRTQWDLQRKLVFWTLLLGDITGFLKATLPVVLPFGQCNAGAKAAFCLDTFLRTGVGTEMQQQRLSEESLGLSW